MFDETTSVSVDIDTARCLNTRHDRAGCRRCQIACPTDAIVIQGSLPVLHAEVCVRCGACAPACPTDAVHVTDTPERKLLEACNAAPSVGLTIACVLHPSPGSWETGDTSPGTTIRHGRCLAAISTEQLIALSTDGQRPLNLDMSWCDQCGIGVAADTVIANAEQANALLSAIAARTDVVRLRGLPGTDETSDSPGGHDVVDSRDLAHSRRGMFSALRRRAVDVADRSRTAAPPPLRRTRGAVPARLPHNVPASRQRLLQRLTALHAPGSEPVVHEQVSADRLPMAAVYIDEASCSGCGLCARYCPTAALTFSTSVDASSGVTSFALGFSVVTCIDCGICAVACPEQAVSFADAIETSALREPTPATLARGELVACASCSLPTATRPGDVKTLCFSCRHGSGVVTALRDDAGLMADLLGRIPPSDQP